MKFLVVATIVACAFAKPVEKQLEKRQLEQFPFAAQSFQNLNQFDGRALPSQIGIETQSTISPSSSLNPSAIQSIGLSDASSLSNGALYNQVSSQNFESVDNVQPEITNVGNIGLNSRTVSSTTAAPPSSFSFDSFNLPTSTISPLFNSERSSINPISSDASLATFRNFGSSQFLPQGFSSTPSPDISSTFSSATFDSFNPNPTAIPIVSSSAIPSNLLQSRFTSNNLLLDNSNFQGIDLNSFNLNNYVDTGSNLHSDSHVFVNSNKAPEVSKSIYFYEAPEELEPVRQRKIVQLPPQKTSYKILFIKAPSAPEPQPIEIPAQVQNNEKTRVYVLVKKPETEQEVRIVAAPTPKPQRPEVFYIKYKSREEAEKAIKEAQEGAALGQESINVDGHQLISKINNARVSHTGGSLLVKQTQSLPSVPLNLFESSTALPFISTTAGFGNIYDSSTVSPLLNNNNFNQFSLYDTPVLSSARNPFSTTGNFYSNGNNLFSQGNNLFSAGSLTSNNLGLLGGVNYNPSLSGGSRFANGPTFTNLNLNHGIDARVGRVGYSEEKEVSIPATSTASSSETVVNGLTDIKHSVESNSSNSNDEPLQLSLGGEESTIASSVFTNAAESSSTTEGSFVDTSSSSSSESTERK